VRDDLVRAEAVVDFGLEDLHLAFRDLGTAKPPDEFLTLPAEHAAGDHFDPPGVRPVLGYVHLGKMLNADC
jgi:hypothetical protein